jgi:ribose transport system permease protein
VLTVRHGTPLGLAVLAGLGIGLGIGVINGILIVGLELNAFVATLGVMTVVEGLTFALTDTEVISGVPDKIQTVTQDHLFGLPLMVYYGWLIALILWYVYRYTPFGRHLLFVGGNPEASRLAGVPVNRTRFGAFFFAGILAAIAGVLLVGSLGAIDPTIAPQYLLQPYAAAFLGTAVIQLGRFNIVGTVVALYLLAVTVSGLQLLGAASWVSEVFNGGALLAAVLFARFTRAKS